MMRCDLKCDLIKEIVMSQPNAFGISGHLSVLSDTVPAHRYPNDPNRAKSGEITFDDGNGPQTHVGYAKYVNSNQALSQLVASAVLESLGIPVAQTLVRPLHDGSWFESGNLSINLSGMDEDEQADYQDMFKNLEYPHHNFALQDVPLYRHDTNFKVISLKPYDEIFLNQDVLGISHAQNLQRALGCAESFFKKNPKDAAQILCSAIVTNDDDVHVGQLVMNKDQTEGMRIDALCCPWGRVFENDGAYSSARSAAGAQYKGFFDILDKHADAETVYDILNRSNNMFTEEFMEKLPVKMGLVIDGMPLYVDPSSEPRSMVRGQEKDSVQKMLSCAKDNIGNWRTIIAANCPNLSDRIEKFLDAVVDNGLKQPSIDTSSPSRAPTFTK